MIMALDTYKKKGLATALLVVVLLVIDQVIKVEVKTGMCLHESIRVTDWFYINFIENNGMAYGMTIGNKLILSLFRVAAISVLGWYLCRQVRRTQRQTVGRAAFSCSKMKRAVQQRRVFLAPGQKNLPPCPVPTGRDAGVVRAPGAD